MVAINEPIFGLSIVMEGVFNGIGHTQLTFIASTTSLWIVRVFGTFIAINVLNIGIYGAWLCMILDNTVRGILLLAYYLKKKAKIEKEIIYETA
jgi:Na+-driven multidrug efflux pump